MKKLILVASVAFTLSTNLFASQDAKEIFIQKCAICHSMTKPTNKSTMLAPPARGVMFHMSEALKTKDKIKDHITDFVLNPTKEKAICKSVRRFGLMPSQEGVITKDELDKVATWMIENLSGVTKLQHEKEQKKERKNKQHKCCQK